MKIKVGSEIYDAELCDTLWKKFRGLMFRKNPKPLFFVFKKPTQQPIHSFFCKKFRAVWMMDKDIVDDKFVKPFRISVRPEKEFTRLLEIPLEN
jgi:uncharacterized membrane protein (UPF0127 family)